MADYSSWGWYSPSLWPGYTPASQDNLDSNGNGLSVDPSGYMDITLHDTNGDGIIWDYDTDDVHAPDPNEYISGPSMSLYPQEIALYTNSTMVAGGVTYSGLDIEVTLFTDGTWGARLMDSSIPDGVHHMNVTSITLGTWNGVEYDGVTIANVDAPFVCFAEGTRIMTETGPRPVENLTCGMRITTYDGEESAILWIGCREIAASGPAAPIRIGKGILGNTRALTLSPHHRVMLEHPVLAEKIGHAQGLAPARTLVDLHKGIRPAPSPRIRYWHILTARHQLVMAEGAWTETLYLGAQTWKMLGPAGQSQIEQALPQIQDLRDSYGPLARPEIPACLCRWLGAALFGGADGGQLRKRAA